MKLPEAEVSEMLERRAADFAMASVPPDAMIRKAGRRRVRNILLASVTTLVVLALVGLSVVPLGLDRRLNPAAGGDGAARDPALSAAPSGQLRLVDYTMRSPARDHPHSTTGPRITVDDVRRHATCMREQGFDFPDPTKQPGVGWAVILDNAEARALGFGSRSFREAWFVTCGPLGAPLTGDMIIGGPGRKSIASRPA